MPELAAWGPIFLLGMMGAGKSTVGRLLAERLDRPFVDLDECITKAAGRPIPEIFASQGEAGFRALESQVLQRAIAKPAPAVIATGGGIVLREQNMEQMRQRGVTVYLEVPAAELKRRLSAPEQLAQRPILNRPGPAQSSPSSPPPLCAAPAPSGPNVPGSPGSIAYPSPSSGEDPTLPRPHGGPVDTRGDLGGVIDALLAARRVRYEASQLRVDASPSPPRVVELIVSKLKAKP